MLFVITAVAFLVLTGIVLSAHHALNAESPVTKRLRTFAPGEEGSARRRTADSGASVTQRILVALGQFGFSRASVSLTQTLSSAGFRRPNAMALFLGARTVLSFGPALLILVPWISTGKPLAGTLWLAAIAWGIGHVGSNWWLRRRSRQRIQRLTEALPDSLDLMVVCLESGLGLNATIARVGEERSALNDPLGREFAQVTIEIRGGRSREEALRALGERNGVDDLKALAGLIIQSDRLGASMGKTLRAHADLLRTRRRQRAEEATRKLPIKVLFPLATLLLPPLFIMVVGPAYLKFGELVRFLVER